MTITEMSPGDRPREKLQQSGAGALGDNELLALVLSQGLPNCGALDLATELLVEVGGLFGLARASQDRLRLRKGIGSARASRIIAAIELGRRTFLPRGETIRITSPQDVSYLLAPEFGARSQEHFGVLLLDTKHRVRATRVLSVGSMDGTYVHPREVFHEAVLARAKSIVLFHNHPSGDPAPSREDELLTHRLYAAGELMGIEVIDHVIIANEKYHSFKESGQMPMPPAAAPAPRRKRRQ
jgi:DNA repair protein RadC